MEIFMELPETVNGSRKVENDHAKGIVEAMRKDACPQVVVELPLQPAIEQRVDGGDSHTDHALFGVDQAKEQAGNHNGEQYPNQAVAK